MSDNKIKVYGYGLAIKWRLGWGPAIDMTATDRSLKSSKGYMGYDDQDGYRYYFFILPELRDEAMLNEVNAGEYGLLINEIAVMPEAVLFSYDNEWLSRSFEKHDRNFLKGV